MQFPDKKSGANNQISSVFLLNLTSPVRFFYTSSLPWLLSPYRSQATERQSCGLFTYSLRSSSSFWGLQAFPYQHLTVITSNSFLTEHQLMFIALTSFLAEKRGDSESSLLITHSSEIAIEKRGNGYRRIWVIPPEPGSPKKKPHKKTG